jgi:hypothetical protein
MATAALAALGAFGAPATVRAAEFHCSVVPCRLTAGPDGTAQTAHQVIVFENELKTEAFAITCGGLKGNATFVPNTTSEFTLTSLAYESCKISGAGTFLTMNGCGYLLKANGEMQVLCPEGKAIEWKFLECVLSIPGQLTKGVGYTTLGTSPNREITVSLNGVGLVVVGSGNCSGVINTNQPLRATITTGNAILTAETEAGVMADTWYQ